MISIKHKKGATFYGYEIELINDPDSNKTLIGSTIKIELRKGSKTGTIGLTMEIGSGITVIDATHASIDKQIINIDAALYYSDVKIIFSDGDIDESQEIQWNIEQNVTV